MDYVQAQDSFRLNGQTEGHNTNALFSTKQHKQRRMASSNYENTVREVGRWRLHLNGK